MRRLEEENALMCEELQATVVELSEARELVRQMGLLKDQGEARLQSILHCMYEQNTVLGSSSALFIIPISVRGNKNSTDGKKKKNLLKRCKIISRQN